MVRVSWFFQNKLTYFDLFYHFIKGEIGPIFSHLLTVRAKGADPPSPPYGQPDRKKTFFYDSPNREAIKKRFYLGPLNQTCEHTQPPSPWKKREIWVTKGDFTGNFRQKRVKYVIKSVIYKSLGPTAPLHPHLGQLTQIKTFF